MSRLAHGGLIDRSRSLSFTFDGRRYQGHPGDTLASALLANDVRLVGRSFKYHRPRGLFTADSSEPNGLVQIGSGNDCDPNAKMTTVELVDGLEAVSQNRWPSLQFDLRAVHDWIAPLISAGFYYKTFMWPASFWEKVYEPLIRKAAGLGALGGAPDRRQYTRHYAHCDVLVVGSGPAGLTAALHAGRAGARTILAEEDFAFGGQLLRRRQVSEDGITAAWLDEVIDELANCENVTLLPRTAIFGAYDGGHFAGLEKPCNGTPYRTWKITAKRTVIATGCQERGIVFGGNDVPGVMLASAIRTYAERFGVKPGDSAVIFTSTDDGWRSAAALARCGVDVAAIVDPRTDVDQRLTQDSKIDAYCGAVIEDVRGGRRGVRDVRIRDSDGVRRQIRCDLVGVSGGWTPNIGLTCHLGTKPVWDSKIQSYVPGQLPNFMAAAGSVAGLCTTMEACRSGAETVNQILDSLGFQRQRVALPASAAITLAQKPVWRVPTNTRKAFVDMQHDVTDADIEQAHREGFRAAEHVKRYTTLGMATDQGRTSNLNGLAILADARNTNVADTGLTSYRPPYVPVPIGALAAENREAAFRPIRLPPSHQWAEDRGAIFVDAGQWKRAQYFPRPGETDWRDTVDREVSTVRNSVGFCDVSTLGKIDIFGPDAGQFLDHLYINNWQKLAVGKARYGLMLREDGFALDDGTTSRLRSDYYIMTTTTAQAGRVFQHMKFAHQCLWPDLDVHFVSVTDQWAQYAVAGPKSRKVLQKLVKMDISNEAFPYMGAVETELCGIPARLYRLSFSGELAYEIAVPARYGRALADALMEAGQEWDICPYGTEALGVMRIEKGHAAGPEIDGQTTAFDLGLGRMMSKKKDYIGRKMAERAALNDPARPTLIGLKSVNPDAIFQAGAHILPCRTTNSAEHDLGYVSSAAYSPGLENYIGLGFLSHASERVGQQVRAVDLVRRRETLVEVCDPHFVDPEGLRLHV